MEVTRTASGVEYLQPGTRIRGEQTGGRHCPNAGGVEGGYRDFWREVLLCHFADGETERVSDWLIGGSVTKMNKVTSS